MDGNKVKTTIMFRGRERSHGELGVRILDRLARELKEIALIENRSGMEGNQMYQIVSPKKSIVERLKSSRDGGGGRVAVEDSGGDEGME
jgi:translation initiation factor IF-3